MGDHDRSVLPLCLGLPGLMSLEDVSANLMHGRDLEAIVKAVDQSECQHYKHDAGPGHLDSAMTLVTVSCGDGAKCKTSDERLHPLTASMTDHLSA